MWWALIGLIGCIILFGWWGILVFAGLVIIFVLAFFANKNTTENYNRSDKITYTSIPSQTHKSLSPLAKQLLKAQNEVVKIAEEIKRSSTIIDYAFFVETITNEWQKLEAKVAQLEKFENMTGIKINMSSTQILEEGSRQYNEGILKAIFRQFDGYKLEIPHLKKQLEIVDYTNDMDERIEYAKKSTIVTENQASIIEELDEIHSMVDEFCSPFISITETECTQNARRLISYCESLTDLAIRFFKEDKKTEVLKALNESARYGNCWANSKLWDYYKEHSEYSHLESEPLYRLCAIGSIKSYRQAKIAINEHSRYKAKIKLAMAYGVGVEDWTDLPKGDRWEWPEDQKGKRPIYIYNCPFEGAYNFRMNRYVELLSNTKYDGYYYFNLGTIKVRRRK